jgi:UDP-N-acetylmuramate--alanine ligase
VLLDSQDTRPVHFVGIAGAGMRALAELFARRGVSVTGCDNNIESASDLADKGIVLLGKHEASHADSARAIVVSSAIKRDMPEIARARELGIPVVRRAEALGEAVSGRDMVGVAGTHGKTTTTVMTTEALTAAGLDPTGIVGGRVASWNGNLSSGGENVFVVEADEYDRSFLALRPTVAVVTNIEADHLDIYADLDDIRKAFAQFVSPARFIVLCADDKTANALPTPNTAEVIRYGIESTDARLVAKNVVASASGTAFDVIYDGKPSCSVMLPVPGLHNVRNALAAIGSGIALGADPVRLSEGLAQYTGVERRFQRIGEFGGVTIVDDYAHHPSEITATLQAARATFPGRRIVAVFQPHLFSRTRDFASEFAAALVTCDRTFLLDLYPAREQPIDGVSSALIAGEMSRLGRAPHWEGPRADVTSELRKSIEKGDVVITIGAGDVTRTAYELKQELGAQ